MSHPTPSDMAREAIPSVGRATCITCGITLADCRCPLTSPYAAHLLRLADDNQGAREQPSMADCPGSLLRVRFAGDIALRSAQCPHCSKWLDVQDGGVLPRHVNPDVGER